MFGVAMGCFRPERRLQEPERKGSWSRSKRCVAFNLKSFQSLAKETVPLLTRFALPLLARFGWVLTALLLQAKRVKAALRMAMAIQQKLQQQASQVRDNEDFKTQLLVADQSPAESTKAVRKSEHDALKHEHALTTNGVEQPSSEQKTPHQPAPSTPARPRRANRKRAARRTRSHRSRKIVGNVLSTIEESPGVEDVVTAEVGRVTDSANSTVVPQKVIEVVDAALAPEHRSRESGNDLPLSPRFSETAEKRSIIPSSKLDALKQHWQAKGQNFPGSSVANSPTNGATAEQDACGKRSPSGRGVIRPDDDWIDPHEKGRILALSSPSAARSPRQKMRARSIQHRTAEAESALNAATVRALNFLKLPSMRLLASAGWICESRVRCCHASAGNAFKSRDCGLCRKRG